MKIQKVALEGIAGLPDISIDLGSSGGRPHDLVLVSGPEASGKTRLLELLIAGLEVIGPYEGIVRSTDWTSPKTPRARLALDLWLDADERAAAELESNPVHAVVDFGPDGITSNAPRPLRRIVGRYTHDPSVGKREYFPENRKRAWGARLDGTSDLEQSLWRCSKDPQKYGFITRFLAALPNDPERSRVFAQGLERLSTSVRYSPAGSRAEIVRRGIPDRGSFEANGMSGVYFSELSSSEANAVIIAATASMIGLSRSVVFLDRPELYVDPERLVSWVHALLGLGADNQWIVASHHPSLREAFQPTQTILLESGGQA